MALTFQDGTVTIEITELAGDVRLAISDKFGYKHSQILPVPVDEIPLERIAEVHRRFSACETRRN